MPRLNRFGCTAQMVANVFRTGSYNATVADFGGAPAVEQLADSICDQIIQNMPEDLFLSLSNVDLEKIEVRATAGQTTTRLGLYPVLAGKTHIWTGQPRDFFWKPRKQTDIPYNEDFSDPEVTPTSELGSSEFTVDVNTGLVTLTASAALDANDEVYASYEPNPYLLKMDSLANFIATGAAYMVGTKHYAKGSSQWQFIDQLQEDYATKLKALRDGEWIPPEVRQMKFWRERTPEADKKSSIQVGLLRRG